MSTNIRNAFRLETRSFEDLYRLVAELRAELAPVAMELALAELADRSCEVLDSFCTGSSPQAGDASPWGIVWERFDGEVREIVERGVNHPGADTSFGFSLFVLRGEFFVILNAGRQEYVDAFCAKVACSEFDYHDGSDAQCAEMSRLAWKRRKRLWGRMLGNWRTPAMSGCCFTVVEPVRWIGSRELDRLAAHFPGLESRVERHAFRLALDELIAASPQETENSRELVQRVFEAMRIQREGQAGGDPSCLERLERGRKQARLCLPAEPAAWFRQSFAQISDALGVGQLQQEPA